MDPHLVDRFTNVLDVMWLGSVDYRPKTRQKLINALQKANRVLYVTLDAFDQLLQLDHGIQVLMVDETSKNFRELDAGIAEHAFKQAEQRERIVSVLPCDETVKLADFNLKLKAWHERDDKTLNIEEPFAELAELCSMDVDLSPHELVQSLMKLGYVRGDESSGIVLALPDSSTVELMTKAVQMWETEMKTELVDVSKYSYRKFAEKIVWVNRELQQQRANLLGSYCEERFATTFPKTPPPRHGSDYFRIGSQIGGLSIADDKRVAPTDAAEQMDYASSDKDSGSVRDMPDLSVTMLSLELQPLHLHSIIHLSKSEDKPKTLRELVDTLASICKATYIASPDGFFMNVLRKKQPVLLGNITKEYILFSNDSAQLITILSPNKKKRPSKLLPARDDLRGTAREYIEHLFKTATTVAQQRGETIVLNDPAAADRARSALKDFLDNASEDQARAVTEQELFDKIVKCSMESSKYPSELIIQSLVESKYLEINAENAVKYSSVSTWRRQAKTAHGLQKENIFKQWSENYQKNREEEMDVRQVNNRKRQGLFASTSGKKTKMNI